MIRFTLLLAFILSFSNTKSQIPVHEEPLHHPVFLNSEARVLDVIAHPGDTSLMHQHGNNYCYVTIRGGSVWLKSPDEAGRKVELPFGFIGGYYENPSNPLIHQFANLSSEDVRLIAVENLSTSGNPGDSIYATHTDEEVVVNNSHFLITKVLIAPNASLKTRLIRSCVIVNLESRPIRYRVSKKEADLGQWAWINANKLISLHNQSKESAWVVVINLKTD